MSVHKEVCRHILETGRNTCEKSHKSCLARTHVFCTLGGFLLAITSAYSCGWGEAWGLRSTFVKAAISAQVLSRQRSSSGCTEREQLFKQPGPLPVCGHQDGRLVQIIWGSSLGLYWSKGLSTQEVTAYQLFSVLFFFFLNLFMRGAGVNHTTTDDTNIFSPASICCGFHGDCLSSACVEADRTWPVLLCRCQRSHSAQSLDRR